MPDPDPARIADGTPLDVEADLRLEVTAASGRSTAARVTGSGRELTVDVDEPDVVLSAVDRVDVGRVADLLAAAGVTVRVVGPDGPAATIGAGASSRVGRAVTGSRHVAPVPRAVARLAVPGPAPATLLRVAAVLAPLLVALAVLRRRRR